MGIRRVPPGELASIRSVRHPNSGIGSPHDAYGIGNVLRTHFACNDLRPHDADMLPKTIHSELQAAISGKLVAMRKAAGLTQRGLARLLRREPSFVTRIEQGERRVDLAEFFWLARACGEDPVKAFAEMARAFVAATPAADSAQPPRGLGCQSKPSRRANRRKPDR